jgi:hypothetical protein
MLRLIEKSVNLNLSCSVYLRNVPISRNPLAAQQLVALERKVSKADIVRQRGTAFNLLCHPALTVPPDVVNTIQQNYVSTLPSVVLMVFGRPGLGKSTLLNEIIQYCLECPQSLDLFKIGNTTTHTTRGCQVLSHPLLYQDRQLVLVDAEGLGGSETVEPALAELQTRLVSTLLRYVSVPYFFISNDQKCLQFVEDNIHLWVKVNRKYGFVGERVMLLFHDKETGAGSNREFVELTRRLNKSCFEGREVIKILNKPSFVAATLAEKQSFVSTLLHDSLYVKKLANGKPVPLHQLFTMKKSLMRAPHFPNRQYGEFERGIRGLHESTDHRQVLKREVSQVLHPPLPVPRKTEVEQSSKHQSQGWCVLQ